MGHPEDRDIDGYGTHYIVFSPTQIINARTGLTMVETEELGGIMDAVKRTEAHRKRAKQRERRNAKTKTISP